jgi:WD40 repeat protein
MVIGTGDRGVVFSVAFHSDGMQLLSGKTDGLRRWRVADGQELGNRMAKDVYAISVSRDGKWIVCGTGQGASVWDAKTQEKAIEVERTNFVCTVDISPESTWFTTGTGRDDYNASIWNIITGERLVGPLQHHGYIAGIKFSPNGKHIATVARDNIIRIFDNHNGDQLIAIKTDIPSWSPMTPLAWSNNGQQVFTACSYHKIKSFDVSTGSQLAESQVPGNDDARSIALAANGKFFATFVDHSISFWDTSTLTQIGPVLEDSQKIWSIALSPDCSYLATGGFDGNITIRNLNNVLPNLYGPFRVSIYACTISSDKSHILSPLRVTLTPSFLGPTRNVESTCVGRS